MGSIKIPILPGMAKKRVFFKKPAGLGFFGFYWVLLGFFGFYWVLLGFIDFSPSNYRVLLGFIGFYWVLLGIFSFLNEFWDVFDFWPFELFLVLSLFNTRF